MNPAMLSDITSETQVRAYSDSVAMLGATNTSTLIHMIIQRLKYSSWITGVPCLRSLV